jgi:hypothetical protein
VISPLSFPSRLPPPPNQTNTPPPIPSGLDFTSQALRKNLSNPSEELSASFRDAYGNTLKQYHSFVIKPIFSAAMSATPYRKDFYAKLGDDQERVQKELGEWLGALEGQVKILREFLGRKEARW